MDVIRRQSTGQDNRAVGDLYDSPAYCPVMRLAGCPFFSVLGVEGIRNEGIDWWGQFLRHGLERLVCVKTNHEAFDYRQTRAEGFKFFQLAFVDVAMKLNDPRA